MKFNGLQICILIVLLILLLIAAVEAGPRRGSDAQPAPVDPGDEDAAWRAHVHSRVRRFRRFDSVEDCDAHESCLLGRRCAQFRDERNMHRDDEGHCQCNDEPHICRLDASDKFKLEQFECIDISQRKGIVRNSHGNCECQSGFCSSPIEKRQWTYNNGLLIRYGADLHCHPLHTPATPSTPARVLQRHPVDGHTCVCSSEQCQRGSTQLGQAPTCVDLSANPHLARQTNSGVCTCADDHCQLSPPGTLYQDDEELTRGPQCAPLKQHPEFVRAADGKCACARGFCRQSGKHNTKCLKQTDALIRSSNDAVFQDYCVCAVTHCEVFSDFESGRVCTSLKERPELLRRGQDLRPHIQADPLRAPTPASEGECMCAPRAEVCQYGYGFSHKQVQCLNTQQTGFVQNDREHCDCPKTHCQPAQGAPRCVVGQRKVAWENACA